MSVRKRSWVTRLGEQKEAWIVDYTDGQGDRHIQTFALKKEADEYHSQVKVDVRQGVHTAPNKSLTIAEAADDWLAHIESAGRERSTLDQYKQHVHKHIVPRIGKDKLSQLTTPRVNKFCDELLAELSRALAKKVLVSLKSILREAQRRGNVAQNVAASVSIKKNKRDKIKLKAGVDIPTPDEVKKILGVATGKWRAVLVTVIFAGLRASELRGLRWDDIDFKKSELHVRQRADRYLAMGNPKSESGARTIPLGPFALNTLKEWKLACPKSDEGIVFPTKTGRIYHHVNILRGLDPILVKAGVVGEKDEAKYALHAFRHFYASWCINRRADGGLELPAKVVQERLGHSSILMTMDTYGHLFPRSDDGAELADAEKALLA